MKDFSSLKSISPQNIIFKSEDGGLDTCIKSCILNEECDAIAETNESCYNIPFTSLGAYSSPSNVKDKVWFKQPVGVCDHYDYIYYKGICFHSSTSRMTWTSAKDYCSISGGQLVVLDTPEKIELISNALKVFYPERSQYFIGATDIGSEGQWRWEQENATNFTLIMRMNNLDTNYPGKAANCGVILLKTNDLVDKYCLQRKHFLCELR
ncbi:unnamed protein product [Mytilus coruscus]|uniref:C-type lectin domain-containing protein n=1 Tax=Mytilus coruscus TaxID=42192 RepID=A0A6J8EZT2_MYTCO|nr:unnamed protein product [Mytilus coruscus]